MQQNSLKTANDATPEEIFTLLQRDLCTAERNLRLDLNQFWNAAAVPPFSILNHKHTELIPFFEKFAVRRLHARASALVQQGDRVPEVTAAAEKDLIPATIQLILPRYVIPISSLQPGDLENLTIDYEPNGYWEYWLDLSWQDFTAGQLSYDLDLVWRHQFQLALRFSAQRDAFTARVEQHLHHSLVDWKPEAWNLRLHAYQRGDRMVGAGEAPAESASMTDPRAISVPCDSSPTNRTAASSNQRRRPLRRRPIDENIDQQLREIAKVRQKSHREVFEMLEGRAPLPDCEPFRSAGGWWKGFRKQSARARSWLSK